MMISKGFINDSVASYSIHHSPAQVIRLHKICLIPPFKAKKRSKQRSLIHSQYEDAASF